MALLGTFVHTHLSQTFAGGAYGGTTLTTLNHSIPLTPDFVTAGPRSIQNCSAPPAVLAEGANGSLATVGLCVGSAAGASAPIVSLAAIIRYVYSSNR